MSDNYEQERRKKREENVKKLIRLIPSFIFILIFIGLVIGARHKTYDADKIINSGTSSSSQQTGEGSEGETQESSQKTRNTAVHEVLDIPETGDAQMADELEGAVIAEAGDGNICVSVVAWNPETFTITVRIDNSTEDDITCAGQPIQWIDGEKQTMSAFKNASTAMQLIPAGQYQCVTYIVDERSFDCETLEWEGALRWKDSTKAGSDTFAYHLPITFESTDAE